MLFSAEFMLLLSCTHVLPWETKKGQFSVANDVEGLGRGDWTSHAQAGDHG